jgi:hypothetical protein
LFVVVCNGQRTTNNELFAIFYEAGAASTRLRSSQASRDKKLFKEKHLMTTVQPEGEDLRKAVKWISEERKYNPEAVPAKLIEEACLKFDLSPMDAEYLASFLKQKKE